MVNTDLVPDADLSYADLVPDADLCYMVSDIKQ